MAMQIKAKPILPDWFQGTSGQALINDELTAISRLVPEQFYVAGMQIGLLNQPILGDFNVGQKMYCDQARQKSDHSDCLGNQVLSLPEALPFAEQSLDLAFLPHTLDYCNAPHPVLHQLSQIMRPEGVMVLTGFHPYSLWGLGHFFLRNKPPLNARFLPRTVLQDWLALLGFQSVAGAVINYQPPMLNAKWRSRLDFLNQAGDRWWPMLGAVYILVVQKKHYGGLKIKPKPVAHKRWFSMQPAQAKVGQAKISRANLAR